MFKVNHKDSQNDASGVVLLSFFVNFEHISHLVLAFLLLALNMWLPTGWLMKEEALASTCF